jgi:hypothetical protein
VTHVSVPVKTSCNSHMLPSAMSTASAFAVVVTFHHAALAAKAAATPYLSRTCTGWSTPACLARGHDTYPPELL